MEGEGAEKKAAVVVDMVDATVGELRRIMVMARGTEIVIVTETANVIVVVGIEIVTTAVVMTPVEGSHTEEAEGMEEEGEVAADPNPSFNQSTPHSQQIIPFVMLTYITDYI